jgi:FAD/FMN-containing dehydrogenase
VATVTAGTLTLPATPDVLAGLVATASDAPDGLTMVASVVAGAVLATLVHAGPAGEGARAVAPFRALGRPLADTVRPMPYAGLLAPGAPERGRLVTGRAAFIDAFGRDDARRLLDRLRAMTGATALAQVRVLGGAIARVPADATAFAHRGSPVLVTVGAAFGRRDEASRHAAWAARSLDALGWGGGGAYVNFLGDEGPVRVRAAYPGATWDRLRGVKRRYDPGNLFRANHNIAPA